MTDRIVSLSEAGDSEKSCVVKMRSKGADIRCSIVDGIDITSDWGYEFINTKWATPLTEPAKSAYKLLHGAFVDKQGTGFFTSGASSSVLTFETAFGK